MCRHVFAVVKFVLVELYAARGCTSLGEAFALAPLIGSELKTLFVRSRWFLTRGWWPLPADSVLDSGLNQVDV